MNVRVNWTATEAADWLESRALEVRYAAEEARKDGYMEEFYEWSGLAAITERAARAELRNPPDKMRPCGVCRGKLRCDIAAHQLVGWR